MGPGPGVLGVRGGGEDMADAEEEERVEAEADVGDGERRPVEREVVERGGMSMTEMPMPSSARWVWVVAFSGVGASIFLWAA